MATPATGRTARLALALGSRNLFFLRVEFIFSTKIDRLIDKGVEDNIEALNRFGDSGGRFLNKFDELDKLMKR